MLMPLTTLALIVFIVVLMMPLLVRRDKPARCSE
jgi:hypothetical protein